MKLLAQTYPKIIMMSKLKILTTFSIPFCLCVLLCTPSSLWAQQRVGCTQTLQLAKSLYQRGELYRIPSILKGCLQGSGKKGFTKNEKTEALKMLILSYIYEEDPEQSDKAMLNFLRTNPQFQINEDVDPEEFMVLYNTFRTWPLFSVGAKMGVSLLIPHIQKTSYITAPENSEKNGTYTPLIGLQVGVSFEIPVKKSKGGVLRWVAIPEFHYATGGFLYRNAAATKNEETLLPNANIEAQINQQRILLNLMMRYNIAKSRINPYVSIGPSISYLLSSSAQIETQFNQTKNIVSGPPIDLTNNFNPVELGVVAAAGLAFQVGAAMLTADVQYRYGLTGLVNENMSINTLAALDYGFQLNKFTQSSIIVSFGFSLPIFVPKKRSFHKVEVKK